MKLAEIKQRQTLEEANEWLKTVGNILPFQLSRVSMDDDGRLVCSGRISLYGEKFSELGVRFKSVDGDFDVAGTTVESLNGFPEFIDGDLILEDCKITSVSGIHKIVKTVNGHIRLNYLTLHGGLLGLLLIEGVTGISFTREQARDPLIDAIVIIKRHLGKGKAGVLAAQQELLDAGLEEYAKL